MIGVCEPLSTEYKYCQFTRSNTQEIIDFLEDTEFQFGKYSCIPGYSHVHDGGAQCILFLKEGDYIVKHPNKSIRIFKPDRFIKQFNIKGD